VRIHPFGAARRRWRERARAPGGAKEAVHRARGARARARRSSCRFRGPLPGHGRRMVEHARGPLIAPLVPSPEQLRASAQQLLDAGRWRDARPLLEGLADLPGCDAAVVRKLAEIEILEGDTEQAIARLERLDSARDLEADFLIARAEERL